MFDIPRKTTNVWITPCCGLTRYQLFKKILHAILNFPTLVNITDMRSRFGLVNQVHCMLCIPHDEMDGTILGVPLVWHHICLEHRPRKSLHGIKFQHHEPQVEDTPLQISHGWHTMCEKQGHRLPLPPPYWPYIPRQIGPPQWRRSLWDSLWPVTQHQLMSVILCWNKDVRLWQSL